MKKCLAKDANRDWTQIKKLVKEFAEKSIPTFDTSGATLRKGTVYLEIREKGENLGKSWFDIEPDEVAAKALLDRAKAYNKKYAPSKYSDDRLEIDLVTALEDNLKAKKDSILVLRDGGEWKSSKSSKITVAAGETIQIKQRLMVHAFRDSTADWERHHPSKYCCRYLTAWSEPFSYTNTTKKKQKLELAMFSEDYTGGLIITN